MACYKIKKCTNLLALAIPITPKYKDNHNLHNHVVCFTTHTFCILYISNNFAIFSSITSPHTAIGTAGGHDTVSAAHMRPGLSFTSIISVGAKLPPLS